MTKHVDMELDWNQQFPFLQRDLRYPFQLILAHASSANHLAEMLREWLGEHWKLSLADCKHLGEYWERWYRPSVVGGSRARDELMVRVVRQWIDDQPNYIGVRYANRLEEKLGRVEHGVHVLFEPRRRPQGTHGDLWDPPVAPNPFRTRWLHSPGSSGTFRASVYRFDADIWYARVELTELTEARSWSLLNALRNCKVYEPAKCQMRWDRDVERDVAVGVVVSLVYELFAHDLEPFVGKDGFEEFDTLAFKPLFEEGWTLVDERR